MTRNTTSDFGMAFAAPRSVMKDYKWINDTRKKTWSVDLDAKPPRIFILDDFGGGTKLTATSANNNTVFEETLFEVEHKFTFAPEFKAYFYVMDAASGFSGAIGGYGPQRIYTLINSVPLGTELYFAEVDETHFRIKHRINIGTIVDAFFPSGYTYPGWEFSFRIRVMILNHPAIYLGGE